MSDERLDAIDEMVQELAELSPEYTIIVEGINDRRALRTLGINADVAMVQSEGGPLKISEEMYYRTRKVIILTDWDDKGETICNELQRNLRSLCVPFDTSIRNRLKDLSIKDIKDVESLPSLCERLIAERGI